MKQTVNETDFISAFKNMGRENNFSLDGLKALFSWLESYEQDTGTEVELDVIALCCEYNELTIGEIKREYSNLNIESVDDLNDHTIVIPVDDESEGDDQRVIFQAF